MLTYVEAEDEDGSDRTKAAPRLDADDGEEAGMRTYALVCSRMLTYSHVCRVSTQTMARRQAGEVCGSRLPHR
jgi:hypothetical protein